MEIYKVMDINRLQCPYVGRKCLNEGCLGWIKTKENEGYCRRVEIEGLQLDNLMELVNIRTGETISKPEALSSPEEKAE